jgi:hypothetical protein
LNYKYFSFPLLAIPLIGFLGLACGGGASSDSSASTSNRRMVSMKATSVLPGDAFSVKELGLGPEVYEMDRRVLSGTDWDTLQVELRLDRSYAFIVHRNGARHLSTVLSASQLQDALTGKSTQSSTTSSNNLTGTAQLSLGELNAVTSVFTEQLEGESLVVSKAQVHSIIPSFLTTRIEWGTRSTTSSSNLFNFSQLSEALIGGTTPLVKSEQQGRVNMKRVYLDLLSSANTMSQNEIAAMDRLSSSISSSTSGNNLWQNFRAADLPANFGRSSRTLSTSAQAGLYLISGFSSSNLQELFWPSSSSNLTQTPSYMNVAIGNTSSSAKGTIEATLLSGGNIIVVAAFQGSLAIGEVASTSTNFSTAKSSSGNHSFNFSTTASGTSTVRVYELPAGSSYNGSIASVSTKTERFNRDVTLPQSDLNFGASDYLNTYTGNVDSAIGSSSANVRLLTSATSPVLLDEVPLQLSGSSLVDHTFTFTGVKSGTYRIDVIAPGTSITLLTTISNISPSTN